MANPLDILRNAGGIVKPVADEAATLNALAAQLRAGSGYTDIAPAIAEYAQQTAASDERLRQAFAESQKDTRSVFDKLEPGILGLGAIVDLARKKRGTAAKFQAYREMYQQEAFRRKAEQRQKYLDVVNQEELLGKRRGDVLNAQVGTASQANANVRQARGEASGIMAERQRQKEQAQLAALKERELKIKEGEYNLELNERRAAAKALTEDPSAWDATDRALLKKHYGMEIEPPEATANRMLKELRDEATAVFTKAVDTEGMSAEEVAYALAAFQLRYIEQAMQSFPGEGNEMVVPDQYGGAGGEDALAKFIAEQMQVGGQPADFNQLLGSLRDAPRLPVSDYTGVAARSLTDQDRRLARAAARRQ